MIKDKDLRELMDRYEYLAEAFDHYENWGKFSSVDTLEFIDAHIEEFKHLKDKLSKVCDLT
jgi:hypothetical protein